MMVQRRSRGRGRSSTHRPRHRHRRSIFNFFLLVLIGVIFIYVTPTTDYFLTTKTIGRVSKAKIRTINTNVTNPIEIKRIKTRNKNTSTPFQKQYIFQINYHKTGHAISFQYRTILRNLLQQNNKVIGKNVKRSRNKKDSDNDNDDDNNSNSNSNFDYELLSTIMTANNSIHTLKRTHSNDNDNETGTGGCPTKQQFWNTLLLNNATTTDTDTDTILINYVNAGPIDLFCNIDENDLFNVSSHNKKDGDGDDDNSDGNSDNSHAQQPQNYHHHEIKIIHLIRNPIDMIVSAYLYHSQRPTPELWVKKKHGVFYNPCNLNYDIIQFYDRFNTESQEKEDSSEQQFDTNIMSQKEGQQIEGLCHTLMYNNDTNKPYRHLYEALTKLSSIHGVQLMTIQLLLSNFHSGSDLLRMVLNIIRLNQWSSDRNNRKNKNKNNNKILTLEMGNDWSFNYTDTVTRTTQFIVEDLEDLLLLQQQQQQQQQHKSNNSTNNSKKQKFITTVTSLMKEQKQKVKIRNDKHFTSTTKKWSNKEEKETIIDQLLSEELLGPILFKLQQVINNAIGLTKHQ